MGQVARSRLVSELGAAHDGAVKEKRPGAITGRRTQRGNASLSGSKAQRHLDAIDDERRDHTAEAQVSQ